MECTLYYNIIREGFPYWPKVMGMGLSVIIGCLVLAFLIEFFERSYIVTLYRAGAIVFILFWLKLGIDVGFYSYGDYRKLTEVLVNGAAQSMEGVVNHFQPAPRLGTRIERFSVGGVTFSYSPIYMRPGFQQTRVDGNPIKTGITSSFFMSMALSCKYSFVGLAGLENTMATQPYDQMV